MRGPMRRIVSNPPPPPPPSSYSCLARTPPHVRLAPKCLVEVLVVGQVPLVRVRARESALSPRHTQTVHTHRGAGVTGCSPPFAESEAPESPAFEPLLGSLVCFLCLLRIRHHTARRLSPDLSLPLCRSCFLFPVFLSLTLSLTHTHTHFPCPLSDPYCLHAYSLYSAPRAGTTASCFPACLVPLDYFIAEAKTAHSRFKTLMRGMA